MIMESLSIILSSSPFLPNNHRSKPYKIHTSNTIPHYANQFFNVTAINPQFQSKQKRIFALKNSSSYPQINPIKLLSPYVLLTELLFNCLPSLAVSETLTEQQFASDKINLEAIVVSIDDFFNKYPFVVSSITFIWLIAIPLTQKYLRKYKFISAIGAFRKLRDEPDSVLLDIRESKSVAYLPSPNLKILKKSVVQVQFDEKDDDEQGFVKKVLEKFSDPANTVICVLDNFGVNSLKVAELLVKSGFKEAYAIKGGARGKKGWQEIQENQLPPSVHMNPKKKAEAKKQQPKENGAVNQQSDDKYVNVNEGTGNGTQI